MRRKYAKDKQIQTAVAFWGHVANVAISIFYYATTYPLPLRTVLLVRLLYCTCSTTGPLPLACCLVISFPYKRSASPSFNTFKECDINWRHLNYSDTTINTLLCKITLFWDFSKLCIQRLLQILKWNETRAIWSSDTWIFRIWKMIESTSGYIESATLFGRLFLADFFANLRWWISSIFRTLRYTHQISHHFSDAQKKHS